MTEIRSSALFLQNLTHINFAIGIPKLTIMEKGRLVEVHQSTVVLDGLLKIVFARERLLVSSGDGFVVGQSDELQAVVCDVCDAGEHEAFLRIRDPDDATEVATITFCFHF